MIAFPQLWENERDKSFELQELKHNKGYALTADTEGQMQINLTGVSITKKPRSDGRYQGYVIDENGHKKYFYDRDYEGVVNKIEVFLQEGRKQKRKKQKKNSPLFGEFTQNWIEIYKKPNLKPKSLYSLTCALKPALEKFSDRPMDSITDDDVQGLLLSIARPRMRDICKQYICAIFKKALVKNIIKRNPCEAIEIKRHKSKHIEGLTVEEQKRLTEYTDKTKYRILIRFLLASGLRIGEALALKPSDIDFDKHTVTVCKNVVFIDKKRIEQDTPKSEAGNRVIPLPSAICAMLRDIRTEYLFPFSYDSVSCMIKRAANSLGFKVTLHILRHTYSNRLEEAGIPPKVKQYLLGHASLDMTQNVYTEVQLQYLNEISDRIRDIFK